MSKKSQLKRAISDSEREIVALEQKRARSQSALVTAMLTRKPANPQDEEFFRVFSALIDREREHLRQLNAELDALTGKKEKEEIVYQPAPAPKKSKPTNKNQ